MQAMQSNSAKSLDKYRRGMKHTHGFEKSFSKSFSAVLSFPKLMAE